MGFYFVILIGIKNHLILIIKIGFTFEIWFTFVDVDYENSELEQDIWKYVDYDKLR